MSVLDAKQIENLYDWLDCIPFSRPKKNLARDFSDGVLTAELISKFFPSMIQIHNYTPSNSSDRKKANWETLNRKALSRLNCPVSDQTIKELVAARMDTTENFLHTLRCRIQERLRKSSQKMQNKQRNYQNQRDNKYLECPATKYMEPYDSHLPMDQTEPIIPSNRKVIIGGNSRQLQNDYIDGEGMYQTNTRGESVLRRNGPDSKGSKNAGGTSRDYSNDDGIYGPISMHPTVIYEQKQQEMLLKEEAIQVLHARIRRLEQTVHVKDKVIGDLRRELGGGGYQGNEPEDSDLAYAKMLASQKGKR